MVVFCFVFVLASEEAEWSHTDMQHPRNGNISRQSQICRCSQYPPQPSQGRVTPIALSNEWVHKMEGHDKVGCYMDQPGRHDEQNFKKRVAKMCFMIGITQYFLNVKAWLTCSRRWELIENGKWLLMDMGFLGGDDNML